MRRYIYPLGVTDAARRMAIIAVVMLTLLAGAAAFGAVPRASAQLPYQYGYPYSYGGSYGNYGGYYGNYSNYGNYGYSGYSGSCGYPLSYCGSSYGSYNYQYPTSYAYAGTGGTYTSSPPLTVQPPSNTGAGVDVGVSWQYCTQVGGGPVWVPQGSSTAGLLC